MRLITVAFALSLAACSSTVIQATPDTSPADATSTDTAVTDAPSVDAIAPDATSPDATIDAVAPDALDVITVDTSSPDVAEPDVIAPDVSAPDVAIDTGAPDAAPPRDLAAMGPNRVAIWTGAITGTDGTARVFYPMTSGTERYPLVVFAHGFQLSVSNYDRLLAHIASWGYVVASVGYPGTILSVDHRNVPAALSAARRVFLAGGPSGFPAGARVDATRAVAMGHSLGGKGAVMAVLDDTAFVAGLALDPVDDNPAPLGRITDATPSIAPERMSSLMRPLGLFGATQSRCSSLGTSCSPESGDYRQFAAAAPSTVTVAVWPLRNFGHMDFVDPGCGLICNTCVAGAAPIDSRSAALRELSVSFLERFTRNDTSLDGAIRGARRDALMRDGVLWDGTAATLPPCR